jgi:transposase
MSAEVVMVPSRRYGIGIDVHSRMMIVAVVVKRGDEVVKHLHKFHTTVSDILLAKDWVLGVINAYFPLVASELQYTIESTATYHFPVVRLWGGQPCILNPALCAMLKGQKTDKLDASILAFKALNGIFSPSYVPSETQLQQRWLLRMRRRFMTQATKAYSRLALLMYQWCCPLGDLSPRSATIRTVIEDFAAGNKPDIRDLRCFDQAQLVPPAVWKHACTLYEFADADLLAAKAMLVEATQLINDKPLYELLQTAPGIGPIAAVTWLAEMEPTSRFPTKDAAAAFAGFDPTQRISAGKVVGTAIRKGNRWVGSVLVQAAQSILTRQTCGLAAWGLARKNSRRVVRVMAVARRLCTSLYMVSATRKPYSEEGYAYGQKTARRTGTADGERGIDAECSGIPIPDIIAFDPIGSEGQRPTGPG